MSSELYVALYPLFRVLKISFIGVMDFVVGLAMGSFIDQAFGQLLKHELEKHPASSQIINLCEPQTYNVLGQSVSNPQCAPMPVLTGEQMKILGLISLAQLLVTLVTGLELRNLFIPLESEVFWDPTGGIVFVLSLMQQPGLWKNSYTLLQNLYRAFWWLEQPKTEETAQS